MADMHYARIMAEYNRWMNSKIYAVCVGISDEVRKENRKAFFKSIHSTLNHLLWADRVWLTRLGAKTCPLTKIGEDVYSNFNDLHKEREKIDNEIVQWVTTLDEHWFDQMLSFESISYKKKFTLTNRVAIMQMFNHQTHHRGQVTTLLSQLGVDYGATDLPVMPGVL